MRGVLIIDNAAIDIAACEGVALQQFVFIKVRMEKTDSDLQLDIMIF